MKISQPAYCLLAVAAFGTLFANSTAWAASIDCSGTKRSKDSPYSEIIRSGDDPKHEMRQAIRRHVISSRDPEFDGAEQTVYAHQDEYAGAGTQVGYFLYTLKNGEKIWARFESVDSTVVAGGTWEVAYQGVFRFIEGTGKYAGIRGGGHYKGTVTPGAGFEETSVCSAQY